LRGGDAAFWVLPHPRRTGFSPPVGLSEPALIPSEFHRERPRLPERLPFFLMPHACA